MARFALLPIAILVLAAGCLSPTTQNSSTGPGQGASLQAMTFGPTVVVDPVRIASEPSVKVGVDGTLYIAGPTGSVKYATRPLDLTTEATNGALQSAIWVSRDNGTTWTFAAKEVAPGAPKVPYHNLLPGAGDAELAIDAAGTVYMADQLGLVDEVVSISNDQGRTWQEASPLASGIPDVDRMWMWPDPTVAGTVYMNYDHNAISINVAKTVDGGKTWTPVEATPDSTAPGPIVATNRTVAFSYFNGEQIMFTHSEDKGVTWTTDELAKGHKPLQDLFPQTVADQSGNLYVAWVEKAEKGSSIAYVFSDDAGQTWSAPHIAFYQPGRALFLWAAAGSAGRLGFSWYGANITAGPYYSEAGIVVGADTDTPTGVHARVSETPARPDAPCEGGTTCTSGRELGDFQTCAVGPDGKLVVSFVIVQGRNEAQQPAGGHVAFAKLAAGPSLFDGAVPSPWVV